MRKTMAAIATVALASVAFGGTALAWEKGEKGGNTNICGSGNGNGNTTGGNTGGILNLLNGNAVGVLNGSLDGNLSPTFCS
jgi:hypothetical protein